MNKQNKTKQSPEEVMTKQQGEWISKGLNYLSTHTGLPINYLEKNLDAEKIKEFYDKFLEKHKDTPDYNPHADNEFQKEFLDYISQGKAINERTRRVIELDNEPGNLYQKVMNFFGKRVENKDPSNQTEKLDGLADLVASDPAYVKLAPELAQSLSKAQRLIYAYNVLRVAKADNLIDKNDYKSLVDKVYEASEKHVKVIPMQIKDYVSKAVASIIGLFGVLTLISQMKLTGAVIGSNFSFSGAILQGLGLILIALAILGIKRFEGK